MLTHWLYTNAYSLVEHKCLLTLHIEPGRAGDTVTLNGHLASILRLHVRDDEAVFRVVILKVVLVTMEHLTHKKK
jgi:hypothetical protein